MGDIYSLFDDFLSKVIIEKKSLFSSDVSIIYSDDTLNAIIKNYIDNPIGSENEGQKIIKNGGIIDKNNDNVKAYRLLQTLQKADNKKINLDFFDKIKKQFESAAVNVKILFAHLIWLRYLPINDTNPLTKQEKIEDFLIPKININFFPNGKAKYGMGQIQIDNEMVHLVCLFTFLHSEIQKNNQSINISIIKELIINWIFDNNQCKTNFYTNLTNNHNHNWKYRISIDKHLPIYNMLLNLCDKEQYEPIAIQKHKIEIVKNLYKKYTKKNLPNNYSTFTKIDEYISEIKEEIKKKDSSFDDFWAEPILSEWKGSYVANSFEILTNYHKQIILYGAPGTGKTYTAREIIKEFIKDKNETYDLELNDKDVNEYKLQIVTTETKQKTEHKLHDSLNDKKVIWEIVQFNQSFSYEDFIEGMRPQINGELKIVGGIFKKIVNVANDEKNNKKSFILIIDEINRGKIDKIFGELLYLLEYRNESLKLHYSGIDFSIPDNLFIIGTMNTADKSIATLDVALRRRFWFVRCEPQEEVLRKIFDITEEKINLTDDDTPDNIKKIAIKLFRLLNDEKNGILKELGDDASVLKIGHSYFLKLIKTDENGDEIEPSFSDLKNIWFYSIIPLLEEYCSFNKKMLSDIFTKNRQKDLSEKSNFTLVNLKSL